MARKLPKWCKEVKKTLIDKDMTVESLAEKIGKTRIYTSAVVNGRIYSETAVKEISDVLGIAENAKAIEYD